MEVYSIAPGLKLINLQPPLPGYEHFFGSYLLSGERKAIVDTGPRLSVPNLLATLEALGAGTDGMDYIILTHIHLDHGGGIGTAHKGLGRARVVAHPRARPHLIDPSQLWQSSRENLGELALKWGDIEPVPAESIIEAEDGMKLELGEGLTAEVYLTPGHAPHHLSLYERKNGVLLAGEAAGVCVNGNLRLTTPPPFRLDVMLSSIDKLIALGPRKICYGHFGCYDDATGRLRRIRQKVIDWFEFVRAQAGEGNTPEDIFRTLREKDKELDYLKRLTRPQYNREHALLSNSVRGLYLAALKEAV